MLVKNFVVRCSIPSENGAFLLSELSMHVYVKTHFSLSQSKNIVCKVYVYKKKISTFFQITVLQTCQVFSYSIAVAVHFLMVVPMSVVPDSDIQRIAYVQIVV